MVRKRTILRLLGLGALAGLLVLAALPWWLGAALRTGGAHYGVTFGEYQRIGYTRFVLTKVVAANPGVTVTVSRLEVPNPWGWLISGKREIAVERWSVVASKAAPAAKPAPPSGWVPLHAQLQKIIDTLDRWLPPTHATEGEVSWPGSTLKFSAVEWRGHTLTVDAVGWQALNATVAITRDAADHHLRLSARSLVATQPWTLNLDSDGAHINGGGTVADQPLSLISQFDATGWLPHEAQLTASGWRVAGARLKLGQAYQAIAGGGVVAWKEGRLFVNVDATGQPLPGGEAPELQVHLQAAGGLDGLSVNRLDVKMPGVEGHLSEPVTLGLGGRLLSGASRFDLTAELAQLPWLKARGRVNGTLLVTPRVDGIPSVEGKLKAESVAGPGWAVEKADLDLQFQWPDLRLRTGVVQLAGGDVLDVGGEWNWQTHTLTGGRVRGKVRRATVARWVPETVQFASVDLSATAAGPWPALVHAGTLNASAVQAGPLNPLAISAEWRGIGPQIDELTLTAEAGVTRVIAKGALSTESARLDEWLLTQDGVERLRLVAPVSVRWKPTLEFGALELKGPQGAVSAQLAWGQKGSFALTATQLPAAWWRDLITFAQPDWTITKLAVQGGWDHGPLAFTAMGAGVVNLSPHHRAELELEAQGDAAGVNLKTLHAVMAGRPVVSANGTLPLTLWPLQPPYVRVNEQAPLVFTATTDPDTLFWDQLAELTGLKISAPSVTINAAGTWAKPTGEAHLRVARIELDEKRWGRAWPELQDLVVDMSGDRSGVSLQTLTTRFAGQEIRASGHLPIKDWTTLVKNPLALAEAEGDARIEIPDADVAALARFAPAYLAPTGRLQIDVSLKPGGQLQGFARLKDAASRPLGPLGILQEIGGEVEFSGRHVELKQLRASAGGQPVMLSGTIELPVGGQPRFDLTLKGEKLPFIRQTGLLVRGDLDLAIKSSGDAPPRITGTARLTDSLFLMDVRSLIPAGGTRSGPARRPPYFSVTVEPFSRWGLDVDVRGDKFLRLRTPVFTGVVSAHFRLGGTLGDPRAIGEVVINQGQVLLPFATFAVRQGTIRIAEADPFSPKLSIIGTSRRYGYDLQMELTGTADKPQLNFTSSPTLESEQVLLMVMAGETPQNEVNYTGRERAARLGAYLGQSLLGQLGADPTASEKFSLDVGARVSRQGRETYEAAYSLTPRWSLVGEYDEFDEYNIGLKWRILTGKTPEPAKTEKAPDATK